MRIKNLILRNIGPFENASVDFISGKEELDSPPVICITGENGTGKSIIIDSIRALIKGRFSKGIERDIISSKDFLVKSDIVLNDSEFTLETNSRFESNSNALDTNKMDVNILFTGSLESKLKKDFIFDYWTSKLSNDSFKIENIAAIDSNKYLGEVLNGIHRNVDLTRTITFFDYLQDSKNDYEKELGTVLFNLLKQIIELSVSDGLLSHISRINLKPIIKIGVKEISLDKLSSGNLYLIQRFTSILSQIYSICTLNSINIADYKKIKGILLIDEAENHLHPKWQKVFLKNIIELFPNLQIIVTTHSPFIVSSIKHSRIYVCKSQIDHSIIEEETDYYTNKPIEEILMSPLFNTSNFSEEITDLLVRRKIAINEKNESEISQIESQLKEQNPEYFNYLNLKDILKSIKK